MRNVMLALTVGAAVFFAKPAASDVLRADHPSEYVVVKGDTLWDISARFLDKPWLWPEIWKKNPQIKNPDLIYPGDVVRLVYIDGKPYLTVNETPRNVDALPVGAIGIDDYILPFLQDLRVVDSISDMPHVLGTQGGNLYGKAGELVYVRGLKGVAVGEEVEIFEPTVNFARNFRGATMRTDTADLDFRGSRRVVDSSSFWNGVFTSPSSSDFIGTELRRVGGGRVQSFNGAVASVLVTDAGFEISKGNRVAPKTGGGYDPYYFPSAGADLGSVRVMAVSKTDRVGGGRDIIALPVGSKQGVQNGNTFSIWRRGESVPDDVRNRSVMMAQLDQVNMPFERLGSVMVFRTFDNVSYGLIMMNAKPVFVGDYLRAPDADLSKDSLNLPDDTNIGSGSIK